MDIRTLFAKLERQDQAGSERNESGHADDEQPAEERLADQASVPCRSTFVRYGRLPNYRPLHSSVAECCRHTLRSGIL